MRFALISHLSRCMGLCLLLWASTVMAAIDAVPEAFAPALMLEMQRTTTQVQPGKGLEYWVDGSADADLEKVLSLPASQWQAMRETAQNFGHTEAPHWFRFGISNRGAEAQRLLLQFADAAIDYIDVYLIQEQRLTRHYQVGDKLAFSRRPIDHTFFVLPFTLAPEQSATVVIRLQRNTSKVAAAFSVWKERAYFTAGQSFSYGQYFFFGLALIMAVFNLFIFFSVRDSAYIWYVVYALSVFMVFFSMYGYGFERVWPEAIWWQGKATLFFIIVVEFASLQFLSSFLHLRQEYPRLHRWNQRLSYLLIGFLAAHLWLESNLIFNLHLVFMLATIFWVLSTAVWVWREGSVHARNYLVAWSPLLLSVLVRYLAELGWVPLTPMVQNVVQIGFALELLLFSMALSYRINTLRAQRRQARAESKAKSEFLANMSHEIRTPMNGVIGLTDLTLRTELNAQQRHYLTQIRWSARHLLEIINDILDFSKIESGRLSLVSERFDLLDMLSEGVKLFAEDAGKKQIDFSFDVGELPSRSIIGDPVRIKQILINLVSNAVKFTDKGEVRVSLHGQSLDDVPMMQLTMDVSDSGIGIDADKLQHIFQTFTQADGSTTRKYGGSGLGLSICRQLAEMMGGTIQVDSEPGVGSRFRVVLPLHLTSVPCVNRLNWDLLDYGDIFLVTTDTMWAERLCAMLSTRQEVKVVSDLVAAKDLLAREPGQDKPPLMLLDADHLPLSEKTLQVLSGLAQEPVTLWFIGSAEALLAVKQLTLPLDTAALIFKPVIEQDLFVALRESECATQQLFLPGEMKPSAPMPPVNESRDATPDRPRPLVLVAEDNDINLEVVKDNLLDMGLEVIAAENGLEAFKLYRKRQPALILMDLHMPEMNGYDATRAIRQWESITQTHVPIVALTANVLEGERERCLEKGFDDYLAKPFAAEDLQARIEQWCPIEVKAADESPPAHNQAEVVTSELYDVCDVEEVARRVNHKMDKVKKLLTAFSANFPSYYSQLVEAIHTQNREQIGFHAHAIKGVSANMGANQLSETARQIEQMAKGDEDMEQVRQAALDLEQHYQAFRVALKNHWQQIDKARG